MAGSILARQVLRKSVSRGQVELVSGLPVRVGQASCQSPDDQRNGPGSRFCCFGRLPAHTDTMPTAVLSLGWRRAGGGHNHRQTLRTPARPLGDTSVNRDSGQGRAVGTLRHGNQTLARPHQDTTRRQTMTSTSVCARVRARQSDDMAESEDREWAE